MVDVDKIKRMQHAIRGEAMKGSVEEALNALMAVAAEALLSLPKGSRVKLVDACGVMLIDYIKKAERTQSPQIEILRPLN